MRSAIRRNVLTGVLLAVIALLTASMRCGERFPPRTPVKPSGPRFIAANEPSTYATVSTDPSRDKILYVFDWGDGERDTTVYLKSGDTARALHSWHAIGTFPVRARAENELGMQSLDWSDTLNVHVDILDSANHPPDPPLGPAHSGSDSVLKPITFWTAATDPDGDSVRIKFYFGDGQPANYGRRVRSRVVFKDTVAYQTPGWKVVYAVAMDPWSDTSAMSAPDSIFINSPPSPRSLRPK